MKFPTYKVAVLADLSNLYHGIKRKWSGKRLSYSKLLRKVIADDVCVRAIAYGAQMSTEATGFITALKSAGWECKYKVPKQITESIRKADWDVGMACDVFRLIDKIEKLILCTADSDLADVVLFAKERGCVVHVYGCGISSELYAVADQCHEISEEYLMDVKGKGVRSTTIKKMIEEQENNVNTENSI